MAKKIFRYLYLVLIWITLTAIAVQTYTAGLAAVTGTISWTEHIEFGFLVEFLGLLQFLLVFPARLPRPANWVSAGLLGTFFVQLLVLFFGKTLIAALHPVLALLIFAEAWWLSRAAWRAVRFPDKAPAQPVKTDA